MSRMHCSGEFNSNLMNISQVCFNTNTNDDKKRLAILSKRLHKTQRSELKVLEALIATALIDDRSAAHWLANHAEDPGLATGDSRHYYLLLCPINDMECSFDEFWSAYRTSRGWCSTMELMPHALLVEPFEATASNAMQVYHAFNTIVRFYTDRCLSSGDIRPVLGNSTPVDKELNFILDSSNSVQALAEAAAQFAELLGGYTREPVIPLQSPFRMQLCSQYQQAQQLQIIKEVRDRFRLDAAGRADCTDTQWQLRLYSRDIRLRNDFSCHLLPLYSMLTECIDVDNRDQLCFARGDRVALVGQPSVAKHAWGRGFNCETGIMGDFPLMAGQRVPSYKAWTLHKVANLNSSLPNSPLGDSFSSPYWFSFSRQSSICTDDSGCYQQNRIGQQSQPSDTSGESSDSVAASPKAVTKSNSFSSFFSERPRRQLHLVRHGERLDISAGFNWFQKAFDQRGVFVNRFDLNIPDNLPTRPCEDFNHDAPLTVIGQFVSFRMGESLAKAGVRYSYCYCSPALRCVQTAHFILSGIAQQQQQQQQQLQIRIEPLLNEFPYEEQLQMPKFMSAQQLKAEGYWIDAEYKSMTSFKNLECANTPDKYLARLNKVFRKILDSTKRKGGTILIVGHRTTLEMCPQILLNQRPSRNVSIPYNALACLDEKQKRGWTLAGSPVPGFSINEHTKFDPASIVQAK